MARSTRDRPFHRSNVRSCTQLLLDTGQNTIPLATLILFMPIFHYIDSLSRVLPTWSSPFSPVKSFQRGTGRFCFDHRRVRNDKLTRLTLPQTAGVNLMRRCLWHYPDINVERSTTLFSLGLVPNTNYVLLSHLVLPFCLSNFWEDSVMSYIEDSNGSRRLYQSNELRATS